MNEYHFSAGDFFQCLIPSLIFPHYALNHIQFDKVAGSIHLFSGIHELGQLMDLPPVVFKTVKLTFTALLVLFCWDDLWKWSPKSLASTVAWRQDSWIGGRELSYASLCNCFHWLNKYSNLVWKVLFCRSFKPQHKKFPHVPAIYSCGNINVRKKSRQTMKQEHSTVKDNKEASRSSWRLEGVCKTDLSLNRKG